MIGALKSYSNKMNMSQQPDSVTQKVNDILSCISRRLMLQCSSKYNTALFKLHIKSTVLICSIAYSGTVLTSKKGF